MSGGQRRRSSSKPATRTTIVKEAGEEETAIFGQEEDWTMETPFLHPAQHKLGDETVSVGEKIQDVDLAISQPQFCSPLGLATVPCGLYTSHTQAWMNAVTHLLFLKDTLRW